MGVCMQQLRDELARPWWQWHPAPQANLWQDFWKNMKERQDSTSSRPRKPSGVDHDHCLPHQADGRRQSVPSKQPVALLPPQTSRRYPVPQLQAPKAYMSLRFIESVRDGKKQNIVKTRDKTTNYCKLLHASNWKSIHVDSTFTPSCRSLGCSLIRHSSKIDTPCHAR